MKSTELTKLAVSSAIALSVGLGVGVSLNGDNEPQGTLDSSTLEPAMAPSEKFDVGAYNVAMLKVRATDPSAIDVMSSVVRPGKEVAVGVSLPAGARMIGAVELFGPTAASFKIVDVTRTAQAGVVWVNVKAQNTSKTPARMVALVHVARDPGVSTP